MKDDLMIDGLKPTPKINPLKYPNVKCDKCGYEVFEEGVILKNIPGLEIGAGAEDVTYPLTVLVCKKCGTILKGYREDYKLGEFTEEDKEETIQTLIL